MKIGVPREIKVHEYRVGLTPESVRTLVADGHELMIEAGAGAGIGAGDEDYRAAGARLAASAGEVFEWAQLIVKVKEPLTNERARLRWDQTIFTYLHLAPDPYQAHDLIQSGVTAIAYETVSADDGGLPLLAPMSVVAGRMATQVAAHYLERPNGGRGVLLAGAPGVPPAHVLVLGGGTVGSQAAGIAIGMGARVTLLDRAGRRLSTLEQQLGERLTTGTASRDRIAGELETADAVIGAALVAAGFVEGVDLPAGARAPRKIHELAPLLLRTFDAPQ